MVSDFGYSMNQLFKFQSSNHPQISSTWLMRMAVLGKDAPEVSISELLGSKSSQGLDHYD